MNDKYRLQTKTISSLVKVFADEDLKAEKLKSSSILQNESFSFQVAFYWPNHLEKNVRIKIESKLVEYINVYEVCLVPVELPGYVDQDEHVLRSMPGLYPDLLKPVFETGITILNCQWRSVWISLEAANDLEPGQYPIRVKFIAASGEVLSEEVFDLRVISARLPELPIYHTEWLHCDCLSTWYNLEALSEVFWQMLEKYVSFAARHDINTILTPLFTLPLDTEKGWERPTFQLVEVYKEDEKYTFDFNNLKRWIDLCSDCGIRFFEFSHLLTPWGAEHAPKIIVEENGVKRKLFGWETDATGPEYQDFLEQFLPAIVDFIKQEGLTGRCLFHISDEPEEQNQVAYAKASRIFQKHLNDFPIIDALSDVRFYEQGLIKNPVSSIDHAEDFIRAGVPDLWVYYCCANYKQVSNRFMQMPLARTRILGVQLYKYRIAGFLHWGYNYWYARRSTHPINPFQITDADHSYQSGDAFLVYPGEDGPLASIRLKAMQEAMQDLRALQLLEQKAGRQKTLAILEDGLNQPLTFNDYPRNESWLLELRNRVNEELGKYSD